MARFPNVPTLKELGVEGLRTAAGAIGEQEAPRFAQVHHALGLMQRLESRYAFACTQVDDLDRVGAQGGDEQSPTFYVDIQVLEPALDQEQFDPLVEHERLRGRRLHDQERAQP